MTKEMLDKLIEQERWETFDSINPGYHRDLLKALTELKDLQESSFGKGLKHGWASSLTGSVIVCINAI